MRLGMGLKLRASVSSAAVALPRRACQLVPAGLAAKAGLRVHKIDQLGERRVCGMALEAAGTLCVGDQNPGFFHRLAPWGIR
jgi:hypothetical protein